MIYGLDVISAWCFVVAKIEIQIWGFIYDLYEP
jgi:hypothetical protein